MGKIKIIAFYLPQFYTFEENDKWWGKGFTEWTNTKKAKPLFRGHYQPREPMQQNYYNLLENDVKLWQIKLAKKYGIYGFCYYHYWFKNGKKLLEKPIEQMLDNKQLDMPFCLTWANEPWSRRWDGSENEVLMPQEYGDKKDWENHFEYLFDFFKDDRYIKIEGKPLFIIYKPELIPNLNDMLKYWDNLAKQKGLKGIDYAYQHPKFYYLKDKDDSNFTYGIQFEPAFSNQDLEYSLLNQKDKRKYLIKNIDYYIRLKRNKIGKKINSNRPNIYSYDSVWKHILKTKPSNNKMILGAFTDWDNTSRRQREGNVYKGSTPEKFGKYMDKLIKKSKKEYKKDLIFINAWNEWAEGAYLEPDEKYKYKYLEQLKKAIDNNQYD